MKAPRHIDKAGVITSIVAAACCLGIPAIVAIVSAVGLGFLINDRFLIPLLLLSLALTLWGLAAGRRRHGSWWPLVVGALATTMVLASVLLLQSQPFGYVSFGLLLLALVLNAVAATRRGHSGARQTAQV